MENNKNLDNDQLDTWANIKALLENNDKQPRPFPIILLGAGVIDDYTKIIKNSMDHFNGFSESKTNNAEEVNGWRSQIERHCYAPWEKSNMDNNCVIPILSHENSPYPYYREPKTSTIIGDVSNFLSELKHIPYLYNSFNYKDSIVNNKQEDLIINNEMSRMKTMNMLAAMSLMTGTIPYSMTAPVTSEPENKPKTMRELRYITKSGYGKKKYVEVIDLDAVTSIEVTIFADNDKSKSKKLKPIIANNKYVFEQRNGIGGCVSENEEALITTESKSL